ncbi:MAG TPA: hypothetical protein VHD81_07925 [Mycobacteriales bacterium]|nr:hypothetical protein [Mycobacteriales bacterium]
MSVKRAAGVLAFAVAAGGVGSAVIVGSAASGAPRPPAWVPAQPVTLAPPPATAPHLESMPKTTLHLPSTLHLVNSTTGARRLDSSHTVYSAALDKPGTRKIIGTAAYTCTAVTSGALRQDCHGALALKNGVILIEESQNINTGQTDGTIVGGSGYYKGAHGTISGRDLGGGKTKLAVDYSFD